MNPDIDAIRAEAENVRQKQSNTAVYIAALAILVAFSLLNTIIPPGRSPDEHAHLERAYRLSKGHLLLQSKAGGDGGPVDDGLLHFIHLFDSVTAGGRLDSALLHGVLPRIRWVGTESWREFAGTAYYFPAIYLPQAAALALGRYMDLSVGYSYQLARLFAFLCAALLVVFAFNLVRPSFAVAALLTMPMVAFQAVSASIDAISLALCILSVSSYLSLVSRRNDQGDVWRIALLCVAIFVLASSRAHALPLLILPFMVAWQRRRPAYLIPAILVVLCTLGWTAYALVGVYDERIVRGASTAQILQHYLLHPEEFIGLLSNTVQLKWKFYRDTFIGQLGFLDVYLPALYLSLSGSALLVLAILSTKWKREHAGEPLGRIVLGFCALCSTLLVFVAMLATWTPFPNAVIEGVQGRYFHIPAMLLAYALSGIPTKATRTGRTASMVVCTGFVLSSAYVTSVALLDRYWLHDPSYAHPLPSVAQRVPITMKNGDTVTGQYTPRAFGKMYAVRLTFGTYFGTSDGVLTLRICNAECANGIVDVSHIYDNRPVYFYLNRPLSVDPNVAIHFSLALSKSHNVVAVWSSREGDTLRSVQQNGQDLGVSPLFQAAIQ